MAFYYCVVAIFVACFFVVDREAYSTAAQNNDDGGGATNFERINCDQFDCSDGDFLVHIIRDCKMKTGLKAFAGDFRKSSKSLTTRQWAEGIADHLESGCKHREIQVAEIHCAELPYTVCHCNSSNVAFVRKTASMLKNCKNLTETILLAVNELPLQADWDGLASFKSPEPKPDDSSTNDEGASPTTTATTTTTPASDKAPMTIYNSVMPAHAPKYPPPLWCISEMTLMSRQMFCEKQELGIVNKLLKDKDDSFERYFVAKRKAAISLLSCIRTGLARFSHCTEDAVSAYLASYYELAIAPGVSVPAEILNATFIPEPSAQRVVIGTFGTNNLIVTDRSQPLVCGILEVNNLLISNDYFDLTAITQPKVDTPKFTQFFASFYIPETPHAPFVTIVVMQNDVRIHYTIDQHLAEDYIEITDTWKDENLLMIRDIQASSLIIFQRTNPDYLNVLLMMPVSVLDHSDGYLISGCDQQGLNLQYENEVLKQLYAKTGPEHIPTCETACREATLWPENCIYGCLLYNDTQAARNVIGVQETISRLFPTNDQPTDRSYKIVPGKDEISEKRSSSGNSETALISESNSDCKFPVFLLSAVLLLFIAALD